MLLVINNQYVEGKQRFRLNTKVSPDWFKELTPISAYVLGCIASDGYVHNYGWNISGDREWLESIRDLAFPGLEVRPYESPGFRKKDGSSCVVHRLAISSKEQCLDLKKLFKTNKSLSLKFPRIPEELWSHFIRGYVDGDGCVTTTQGGRKPYIRYKQLAIYGTELFLRALSLIVSVKVGLHRAAVNSNNRRNTVYRMAYTSRSCDRVLSWIGGSFKEVEYYRRLQLGVA